MADSPWTEAGVVGTWIVGFLAVFGEQIRTAIFKPKLYLELKSRVGINSPQTGKENGVEVTRHARYFHLRVTNRAKYATAADVQVLLLGVERLDDEDRRPGDLYVPLPLGWENGLYPIARPVGFETDATADLLYVREDGLRFVPVVVPHNFQAKYIGKTRLRVTAVARGLDCESNTVRLNIDWDGTWVSDDGAMQDHFKIDTVVNVI